MAVRISVVVGVDDSLLTIMAGSVNYAFPHNNFFFSGDIVGVSNTSALNTSALNNLGLHDVTGPVHNGLNDGGSPVDNGLDNSVLDNFFRDLFSHCDVLGLGLSQDDRGGRRHNVHGRGRLADNLGLGCSHIDGGHVRHVDVRLGGSNVDLLLAGLHDDGLVRCDLNFANRGRDVDGRKLLHVDLGLLLVDVDVASGGIHDDVLVGLDADLGHGRRNVSGLDVGHDDDGGGGRNLDHGLRRLHMEDGHLVVVGSDFDDLV